MGLLFGDGGLFNRIGNAIAGNGFVSDSDVARNQAAKAAQEEQARQQQTAQAVANTSGMNAEDSLNYLMQNDPSNSSAYAETMLNYKLNSPTQKMEDLKKAGINPLLAINGGTTFQNSPTISTAMAAQNTNEDKLSEKYKELQYKYATLGYRKEAMMWDVFNNLVSSAAKAAKG